MAHKILAIAGSPRRDGNSELLLDSALKGIAEAAPDAQVTKLILNELDMRPCQNCGACAKTGVCVFSKDDAMGAICSALDDCDRFIVASPIYFATVSAQLKIMIDRCQAIWARKYLLKQRPPNPDRKALFLCCGGFDRDQFFKCARQVVAAWCICLDITLEESLFYRSIDAKGDILKHPTALSEAYAAGRKLVAGAP